MTEAMKELDAILEPHNVMLPSALYVRLLALIQERDAAREECAKICDREHGTASSAAHIIRAHRK